MCAFAFRIENRVLLKFIVRVRFAHVLNKFEFLQNIITSKYLRSFVARYYYYYFYKRKIVPFPSVSLSLVFLNTMAHEVRYAFCLPKGTTDARIATQVLTTRVASMNIAKIKTKSRRDPIIGT